MIKPTHSMNPFPSIAESIPSLLANLTSSGWFASVCNILINNRNTIAIPSEDEVAQNGSNEGGGDAASKIKDEVAVLTAVISQLNLQRRKLLCQLLDLKGNIRVFCRVRPLPDSNDAAAAPIVPLDSDSLLVKFSGNKAKVFAFDKVFRPASSQDEVFLEVEPIIKSALDGYNACIFAYGQTGTGKTFTMDGTADFPGIVPRSLEALFKQAADCNHKFIFKFSMLEIYMGHLRDLLITRTADSLPQCLSMKTSPAGDIEIENLVMVSVNELSQAMKLYKLGCRSRSTGSTESNTTSSRSHCMIRISMSCYDASERRRLSNKLWLVDLGGSERVLKTKASGRTFAEGKAINLSLSALGDVIHALQTKKHHIPYRNSKLTQVLKDSLGEDSKTLMLVHVSPREEDLCETVCSLNFATRVKSIQLGIKGSAEVKAEKEAVIRNLQHKVKQIEDKRNELKSNINKLNEKLELLIGVVPSANEQMETTLQLSAEDPISNTRPHINSAAATSSSLPRFMRQTVCSRTRSGAQQGILKNKPVRAPRKRKPQLHRAESVTFPIQRTTEVNSECSVSRISCLDNLHLQAKSSADNETEYSHDISDSDIRMIYAFEPKEPEGRSSYRQSHLQFIEEDYVGGTPDEYASLKISQIDHWLHSHENVPSTSVSSRWNKRILAPVPKERLSGRGTMTEEAANEQIERYTEFRKGYMETNVFADKGLQGSASKAVTDDLSVTPEGNADMITSSPNISLRHASDDGLQSLEHDQYEKGSTMSAEHSYEGRPHAFTQYLEMETRDHRNIWRSLSDSDRGNAKEKDHEIPNSESLKNVNTPGICNLLRQKAQIMCSSMLLGLGIQGLGLDHEFFYALML